MTFQDDFKPKRQSNNLTPLGLLLLAPLVFVLALLYLRPAILTFYTSLTDYSVMREAQFIGFENYGRIFSDPRFFDSWQYTFMLVMSRAFVMLFAPALIGILIGNLGKAGRSLSRALLGILGALISPIALITLWRGLWGLMWGREPAPDWVQTEFFMLGSPQGAVNSTLMLDSIITLAIAVTVGGVVYSLGMRGREINPGNVSKVVSGVWIISILLAVGSSLGAFAIPFVLTRGGPANATTSFFFSIYQQGFMSFRFGYASAHAMILIISAIIGTIVLWLVVTIFRLRLAPVENNATDTQSNALSIITIPLILLAFLPIIGLSLWGYNIAASNNGFAQVLEGMPWRSALPNLVLPINAIWLIQIPITYCAALALGLMRPINRRVSDGLFLVLLVLAFLPREALLFQWFIDARNLGILNTGIALAFPCLVSGLSLLVFKLYFDGMYDDYQEGRANLLNIVGSSIPLVLLVGLVATFASIQSILWPLIATNSPQNWPPALLLVQFTNEFVTDIPPVMAAAVIFIGIFFIPFAVGFGALSYFALDKLALVGGDDDPRKSKSSEDFDLTTNDPFEL